MRLLAFGDSSTRGEGLQDVFNPQTKTTRYPLNGFSSLSWPRHLAYKLDAKCVNLAQGGSSNREIATKITRTEFLETDTVCVLWTFPQRAYIHNHPLKDLKDPGLKLSPWKDRCKNWYRDWYVDEDRDLETVTYMELCRSHVLQTGARYAAFTYVDLISENSKLPKHTPLIRPDWSCLLDRALDGDHPGPKTQEQWARRFYARLKKSGKNRLPGGEVA